MNVRCVLGGRGSGHVTQQPFLCICFSPSCIESLLNSTLRWCVVITGGSLVLTLFPCSNQTHDTSVSFHLFRWVVPLL